MLLVSPNIGPSQYKRQERRDISKPLEWFQPGSFRNREILMQCQHNNPRHRQSKQPQWCSKDKQQHYRHKYYRCQDSFHFLMGAHRIGFIQSAVAAFTLLEFLDGLQQMQSAEIRPESLGDKNLRVSRLP